ncbi:HAD hydrolase-like protein [Mesorhizobium sp. M7A.F.Ca.MR.245.00.0.0]|uniref:HAD hydrolase-like protein n=1 Tax=Mesorhizobium sp. M7A.F.Ca.MR.245.00.0.0 TaxID=2496778 RepID=UPI00247B1289|nr:HAD hydrolase-like protein [Mesorhizobium sp. M7A.F.Ca.MR.245.00.0.0]
MNVGAGRPLRSPKAILFDLDGTLVDSAPDIAAAVNELLASRGLPPLRLDQVTAMIGGGVRKLIERASRRRERHCSATLSMRPTASWRLSTAGI